MTAALEGGEWSAARSGRTLPLGKSRYPSRKMRWAGHVARMGEERGVYMFLVRKPEGKRPLGRARRR